MKTNNQSAAPVLLAAALAVGTAAAARADAPDEEELTLLYGNKASISLVTGSSQPLRRAPAVATVITAEEIAAMGARDLDDVLETVPGLHVSRSVTVYSPLYLMRGIGGGGNVNPQVLSLLNGVPMTTNYSGDHGNTWISLPVANIERIEVLRGPGSALYGADAFAGVINIITKDAAQMPGLRTSVQLASFGSRDAWFSYGGEAAGLTVAAWLQLGHTDGSGQRIEADAQTLNDSRFGTHASLAPGPMNLQHDAVDGELTLSRGKWRWHSNLKWRGKVGFGPGVNGALDPNHSSKSMRLTSDLGWQDTTFADNWSVGAQLSMLHYVEDSTGGIGLFPPGARLGPSFFPDGMIGGPGRWERNVQLSAFAVYSGWHGHTVRSGAGHDDVRLTRAETVKNFLLTAGGLPVPTGPVMDYNPVQPHILPQRRTVDYAYVQDEWLLAPDWALTAGLRHDRYSDFGPTTNPRLALVWDSSVTLTTKLLFGRAFRAPAFNELYSINPVANGNPQLLPETIQTSELAFTWQASSSLSANLNLFRYSMTDLVRPVANPAPAPGSTYRNIGRVKGNGAEMELLWDVSAQLHLSANYARQSAHDQNDGRDPGYAPRHHAYARADWRIGSGILFSPQINWVAGRHRASGDARTPIADYRTLDATWSLKRGNWQWALIVRNMTNADVREPSLAPGLALPYDIPTMPRALALQLNVAH